MHSCFAVKALSIIKNSPKREMLKWSEGVVTEAEAWPGEMGMKGGREVIGHFQRNPGRNPRFVHI